MMMPSIFGNNFVDDVFDDMFPFTGNYTTANYDLMKTDVKDADSFNPQCKAQYI